MQTVDYGNNRTIYNRFYTFISTKTKVNKPKYSNHQPNRYYLIYGMDPNTVSKTNTL